MKKLGEFLKQLAPDLIQLGIALYRRYRGDVTAARRDIRSRTEEIAARRARRDQQLDDKY